MCGGSGTEAVVDIIGWIYFFAWSISFYGQVWENYKLKRAEGCKLDYLIYNFSGYFFYSIYNVIGFWGDASKNGTGDVEVQDVVFALHALTLTSVAIFQCFIYPRGQNKLSPFCYGATIFMWCFALVYSALDGTVFNQDGSLPPKLSLASWLGYMKLIITVTKYITQAIYNFKRGSTKGWSIFNIMCDITGGSLSVLQGVISAIACGESPFGGGLNLVKYLLGIFTIIFDVIFILQHFVFYRHKKQKNSEDLLSLQSDAFSQRTE